jgi:valyl-tRNA synthetase
MGEDGEGKAEAQACAAHVLAETYKLLHPFMPFVTEEMWGQGGGVGLLCHARWPEPGFEDAEAAAEIAWLLSLIGEIRSVRTEMNVKPADKIALVLVGADASTRERALTHAAAIGRLARVDGVSFADAAPKDSAQIAVGGATACLPLEGLIDFAAERARIGRETKRLEGEVKRLEGKLGNAKFVANAPEEVVAEEREKLARYADELARMRRASRYLGA